MEAKEVQGICSCCGAGLKWPVIYQGKVWGHDCLETHLGTSDWKYALRDGKVDEETLRLRKEKHEADLAKWKAEANQRQAVREASLARLTEIEASPLVLELVKAFKITPEYNYWQYSSQSFLASLFSQVFNQGHLTVRQVEALAKKLKHKLSDLDVTLTTKPVTFDSTEGWMKAEAFLLANRPGHTHYVIEHLRKLRRF